MDYEAALISKVISEKCMGDILDMNVKSELFSAYPSLWKWVCEVYSSHGDSPPIELVEDRYPEFAVLDSDSSVSFLVEELRKRRAHNLVAEGMKRQADFLKAKDPYSAVEDLRRVLLAVDSETVPSRDVNILDTTEERLERYRNVVIKDGMTGLPTPWEPLNEVTQGFQEEDLIMIAGRAKMGKTWIEVVLATFHWCLGYKVLLFSREMSVWQIVRRFDAVNAKLPFSRFKSGRLTTEELERWKSALGDMKDGSRVPFWVTGDDEGSMGVSGILAKVRKYKPQIVYIDGGYLIEDERGGTAEWSRFANVCWDLKRLARKEKIPFVMTHQFNKEGLGKDGSGDTLKFGDVKMWFDLIIGVYRTEDLVLNKEMLFRVLDSRDGETTQWVAGWDLDMMDFEVRELGRDDISDDGGSGDSVDSVEF